MNENEQFCHFCKYLQNSMIHQFPIQYAAQPRPQPQPLPPLGPNSQSLLIDQLRKENQMLKQQLQTMIRMQAQSPPPTQRPNFFINTQVQNNEDETEMAYRNKMSKLKTKKSNRKSLDHSATAPCSPKASFLTNQQPIAPQTKVQPVPNILMIDPRCKMMVISKDKDGKFFRDRSQEKEMMTIRRGDTSQERRGAIQSPPFKGNYAHVKQEPPFAKMPKGHQRVESAYPYSHLQKTERISKQVSPSPTLLNISNNPPMIQYAKNYPNFQFNESSQKRQIHPFPFHKETAETRVPRGNIYVQNTEEKERHHKTEPKEIQPDLTSEGDSQLSIQMDLRKARSNRRLNYDIYLQEERL